MSVRGGRWTGVSARLTIAWCQYEVDDGLVSVRGGQWTVVSTKWTVGWCQSEVDGGLVSVRGGQWTDRISTGLKLKWLYLLHPA